MVEILMVSAKLVTLGLLRIKVMTERLFRNKSYDVIIPDYDVTNKILSRESNYIVNVIMSTKFGNSSIYMREVIIKQIL